MLRSPPVWGLVVAFSSFDWALSLLLTSLPQYMLEVLSFDISSNGAFSMLPHLSLMLVLQVAGPLSDFLLRENLVGVAHVRKLYVIVGSFVPAVLFIALSFLDCSRPILAVSLLALAAGTSGFSMTSLLVNLFDVASVHAGQLMTITHTVSTATGVLVPLAVSAITVDRTRLQWQAVFFLTAGVLVAGGVVFTVLGRGQVQEWAESDKASSQDGGGGGGGGRCKGGDTEGEEEKMCLDTVVACEVFD